MSCGWRSAARGRSCSAPRTSRCTPAPRHPGTHCQGGGRLPRIGSGGKCLSGKYSAISRIDLTDFNPHLMFLHRFHQCSRLELTAKLPQLGFTQNSVTRNCGHVTSEEKYLYVTKNIYRPSLPPAGLGLHEAGVPREVRAARLPALVEDVLRHRACLGLSQTEMILRYPIRIK